MAAALLWGCSFLLPSAAASQASDLPHRGNTAQAAAEEARYAALPPTVFAPGGRLHGVERVAREALLLDSDADGEVACGAVALHCGGTGGGEDGEFAVLAGIGAVSPFLHRDEFCAPSNNAEGGEGGGATYLPLEMDEPTTSISSPLSILSPTLIAAAGGKAIDSTVLLRRATEVALSMYANDNGGVDWFVSHSLEGPDGHDSVEPWTLGGAAGVEATALARRVADMAQGSTQSLGGQYGRMLSSSLLAVGARTPSSSDGDALVMWRVDPTGQFWRVDASAVGRGALDVESELLSRIRSWKKEQSEQRTDASECNVLQEDVRAYLGSLSVSETVEIAKDCLIKGIMKSRRVATTSEKMDTERIERGLRKRIRAVAIRSGSLDRSKPRIEVF
ncbi:hypothetical protein ACHAXT_005392 [Thalassiosira profunda]